MTSRFSVAFVDDHPLFLDGLSSFFARTPEFSVVASGTSADDAVSIAGRFNPNLLLMDIRMPGDPFAAMKAIKSNHPRTSIIAFTAIADVTCATSALEAGASGYVLKGATTDELTTAIHAVVAGDNYITPAFATKVIAALREAVHKGRSTAIKFNVREGQIVSLLLNGATNKEIGHRLQISEKTVRHYMTLLMRKLNARNRLEVALIARNANIAQGFGAEFQAAKALN